MALAAPGSLPPLPTRAARSDPVPNATLTAVVELTETVRRLRVRPDDGVPAFAPGQYFAIGLECRGRLAQRPYSAASTAGEAEELEFLVRHVPAGVLTPRLWRLRPGARLRIGRPKGLFTLVRDDARTHLFVATGTGIAPFIAMIAALRARPRPPRIVAVQGASKPDEIAYRDSLARPGSGVTYLPAVSRPDAARRAGWAGAVGRVRVVLADRWVDLGLDPLDTVAYLCGNPGMIDGTRTLLREMGLPAEAIRSEEFWAGPATDSARS
jgi:ferredoxin/flavodoxin---NADP+ reductase